MEKALLAAGLALGLVVIPFGLPGTLLMAGALLVYGWATGWQTISVALVAGMAVLALASEVADNLLSAAGTQRYGGSRYGMIGALVGGVIGALVGVPVPLIGSVIGGFAGAFLGAGAAEWYRQRDLHAALRAGWGAFLGRAGGTVVKMLVGVVILVWGLFAAF